MTMAVEWDTKPQIKQKKNDVFIVWCLHILFLFYCTFADVSGDQEQTSSSRMSDRYKHVHFITLLLEVPAQWGSEK